MTRMSNTPDDLSGGKLHLADAGCHANTCDNLLLHRRLNVGPVATVGRRGGLGDGRGGDGGEVEREVRRGGLGILGRQKSRHGL